MTEDPAKSVWDAIEDLLDTYDGEIQIKLASERAWSGQIRLTLTDPEGAPSRSMTFFSAGGIDPEAVAEHLLADVADWLSTSGVTPLPAPPWAVD